MMHKTLLPALAALILALPVGAKAETNSDPAVAANADAVASEAFSPADGPATAHANFQENTRLGFLNGLLGSGKVDLYLDGKSLYRNVREERSMKPKTIRAEGYSIQVNAAKIGLNYVDFTKDLVAGRDYTLVASGVLDNGGTASSILVDIPNTVIAKTASNLIFVNAAPDLTSAKFLVDSQVVAPDVMSGTYSEPLTIGAGKHIIEVLNNGFAELVKPLKLKTKGATTITFVLTGTVAPDDHYGLSLERLEAKSPK